MKNLLDKFLPSDNDVVSIDHNVLKSVFEGAGSTLSVLATYEDLSSECKEMRFRYQLSESLNIVIRFEDDGTKIDEITTFLKYLNEISEPSQGIAFCVKSVKTLSSFPINVLFCNILPINQLRMSIGKGVYKLIHSDEKFFKEKFRYFREMLSEKLGITILPLLPSVDNEMDEYGVKLIDTYDDSIISEFCIDGKTNKYTIDIYLQKLLEVYLILCRKDLKCK